MTIYVSSRADLAAMLSVAAGFVIAESDLQFGTPHPTTTAEQTQYGRNTKINVGFTATSTLGVGTRVVYYDRLDIAPLTLANLFGAKVASGSNMASMLPVIKNFTGAVLNVDDLVEHSTTQNPDTLAVEFLMEASPTSIGWFGSGTLKFNPPMPIAQAFPDDTLPGF